MKIKATILSLTLAAALLAGCGAKEAAKPAANTNNQDTVATASVTDKEAVFEKTIGSGGNWIIAATKDLTFDHEIKLDGEFKNGKKNADGTEAIQRKIAIYTQDADHKVTGRFTLTAPKLTVTSPNARIQGGTFKGDVIVDAKNFELVDAKIEGNLYFTKQEYMDQFKKTNGKDGFVAEVTGTTSVVK